MIESHYLNSWKHRLSTESTDYTLQGLEGKMAGNYIISFKNRSLQLLSHLYRLVMSPTNECPCGTGIQDQKHLQTCPTYAAEQNRQWPDGADFHTKLYIFIL